jgi:hypothetical protein
LDDARCKGKYQLISVRPQMVDFGSEQGLSNFETAGASEANARGA